MDANQQKEFGTERPSVLVSVGFCEEVLRLPGSLVARGTRGVGGDALQRGKRLWPDTTEAVDSHVSAAPAAGVAGEALEIEDSRGCNGAEDGEQVSRHFEKVKHGWIRSNPVSNGSEWRGVWQPDSKPLSEPPGLGCLCGRQRARPEGGGRAFVPIAWIASPASMERELLSMALGLRRTHWGRVRPPEGGFGRWWRRPMEGYSERKQDKRQQGDGESGLHTGMVEGVYG